MVSSARVPERVFLNLAGRGPLVLLELLNSLGYLGRIIDILLVL